MVQQRTQAWLTDLRERISDLEVHKDELTEKQTDELTDLVRTLNRLTEGPF